MPAEPSRATVDVERLSLYLKCLANPGRLEMLWMLRVPTAPAELHVTPRRRDGSLAPDRAMSRQAVQEHLESLEAVGIVEQIPDEPGRASRRVLSQARLFAILEELRALTAIPPSVRVDVDATLPRAEEAPAPWPAGPRLVLAGGPWEGRAFPLEGDGPWTVGRAAAREVQLAYDPFVSAEHAEVRREDGIFVLVASPGARNATRVNFRPLLPGEARPLAPGDVVGVGRSLLVLQA